MKKISPLVAGTISFKYGSHRVLHKVSIAIPRGKITTIIGPNGSGKSTLLYTLARLLRPASGVVYLDGKDITRLPTRDVAKKLAILSQSHDNFSGITVGELIEQGRYPHAGPFSMLRHQDHIAISQALRETGMHTYVHRPLDSLSGGEKQRAWIALALAQDTSVLLLDEPTTFLDISHQLEILELLKRLHKEKNMTIVLVLHDINHAIRFSDYAIVLDNGHIAAEGTPSKILTKRILEEVFHIKAEIVHDKKNTSMHIIPYART